MCFWMSLAFVWHADSDAGALYVITPIRINLSQSSSQIVGAHARVELLHGAFLYFAPHLLTVNPPARH
jgi:hypothetical protein